MVIKSFVQQVNKKYLIIFKFLSILDQKYTTSDGYIYSYFLDNTLTVNHQYVMFGIRELNSVEYSINCPNNSSLTNSTPPITDQAANFSANFYNRAYTSACYYLNKNSYWATDGLTVSLNNILLKKMM
jgi:hypothetical protein